MKKEVQSFLDTLHILQKVDSEFPLQYAICFAEIALNEGLSLTQLSQKTGMALSTVSRIVGALSDARQKGAPYGLIRVVICARERRRKELYLTAKGNGLLHEIVSLKSCA